MKRIFLIFAMLFIFLSCNQNRNKRIDNLSAQDVLPNNMELIDNKYIPPTINEKVEYKKNELAGQLEIYAVSDTGKRLLSILSYNDYDDRLKVVLTKTHLFYINWEHTELMQFEIKTGVFSSTGIPCGRAFDISPNEQFVCVSVENKKLKNSDTTLLPCLYDFKSKKMLKDYYFEFLEDEIGIRLTITYNESKNRMDIRYNWDTPIPQFEGFISLDNYEFTRTK